MMPLHVRKLEYRCKSKDYLYYNDVSKEIADRNRERLLIMPNYNYIP